MGFLGNLQWRYATKKYNGQPIADADLQTILEAARFAPSSSNTQPYHIVVTSGEMKNKLITSSGQVMKIDAAHLLVFCTRTDYPARADKQLENTAAAEGVTVESLAGLRKSVDATINRPAETFRPWAARQTYIALGFALAAAAELKVDSSPMEGFKPDEFKKILELPEYMDPVVIMALGYRDPEDHYQPSKRPKVRFPKDDLFEFR